MFDWPRLKDLEYVRTIFPDPDRRLQEITKQILVRTKVARAQAAQPNTTQALH